MIVYAVIATDSVAARGLVNGRCLPRSLPQMIVYAVIATDSVAARGLVNGRCLPRSGRRDILSVAITAFIFIGVILRIIVKNFKTAS